MKRCTACQNLPLQINLQVEKNELEIKKLCCLSDILARFIPKCCFSQSVLRETTSKKEIQPKNVVQNG